MPEQTNINSLPKNQLERLGIQSVDDAVRIYERQLHAIATQQRRRLPPHVLMTAAGKLLFVAAREKGDEFASDLGDRLLEIINSHTLRTHSHVAAGAIGGVLAGAGIKIALEKLMR